MDPFVLLKKTVKKKLEKNDFSTVNLLLMVKNMITENILFSVIILLFYRGMG